MKELRVIVCGGRDFDDGPYVFKALDELHGKRPFWGIWHGNSRGADLLAHDWATQRGVRAFPVPADWSKHGKSAGPKRNQAMLGNGIGLVVAFPGGRGTADMVKRARNAPVPVVEFDGKTIP